MRWWKLRGRRREINDEIESFASELRDDWQARGLDAGSARQAAARAMGGEGGVEQIAEATRAVHRGAWLGTVGQDIRYGARLLRRSPATTALAIAALALGIGANTALFSLVRGVLLAPLPYPRGQQLAMVFMDFAPQNNPHGHMSMADFFAWQANNRAFSALGIYQQRHYSLFAAGHASDGTGAQVSSGIFDALGIEPLLGRRLQSSDDAPGNAPVAVVSQAFWREHLGGNPRAVGQPIEIDGRAATLVGVMPLSFAFPSAQAEIWTNLPLVPPSRLGPYFYLGIGRLRDGVNASAAQRDTDRIAGLLGQAHPQTYRQLRMPVEPLRAAEVGPVEAPLLVAQAAVCLVLLIAIVNVAGLLLARADARAGEMAVRVSLGAGGTRLLRQLLTESLLLGLAGGGAGLGMGWAALHWFRAAAPTGMPGLERVRLDGWVLTVTLAAGLAAGIFFGLAPAWQAARAAKGQPRPRRNEGSRSALVVAEMALAMVLLCAAGLLLRSLARLEQVDDGVHAPAAQIYATTVTLSGSRYRALPNGADSPAGLAFDQTLLEQAGRIPGVQVAAISDSLPPFRENDDDTFTIQGQPWRAQDFPSVTDANVSPGYFQALGIPLLAGRVFTADDKAGAPPVIIISQSVARNHFGGASPLGHYIKDAEPSLAEPWDLIVGVVGNARYQGLDGSDEAVYRPAAQNLSTATQLVIRTALPAATLAPQVRAIVAGLDREAVVSPTESLDVIESEGLGPQRFLATLLAGFALLALALAAIGIYGVIAYSVNRRTREIGMRMALGAGATRILRQVLGRGLRLGLLGAGIGLGGALLAARLLAGLLFDTNPSDPLTLGLMTVGLITIALAASLAPAWRAARLAPAVALRRNGE